MNNLDEFLTELFQLMMKKKIFNKKKSIIEEKNKV